MSEELIRAEPGDAIISTATGRILLNVKGKLRLLKGGGDGFETELAFAYQPHKTGHFIHPESEGIPTNAAIIVTVSFPVDLLGHNIEIYDNSGHVFGTVEPAPGSCCVTFGISANEEFNVVVDGKNSPEYDMFTTYFVLKQI